MVTNTSIPPWLKALYPFEPKSFRTPHGAQMSYVDEGRGTAAVLMLHGNPTWSFYYRNMVKAVSGRFRCIVPDHIGMGLSEKPQDYSYRLLTRIADIEALVQHLGLTRIHLIVHDWGGAIGCGFAVRHPGLIGKITILNTAAFPDIHIPARIALCRAPVVGEWIVRGLNGFAGPATTMSMHARTLTVDERRGFLFPYDSWAHRIAVYKFVEDIPMEPSHPSWATLAEVAKGLPTLGDKEILITWGGRDFCFNDHFLARWQEIFPKAQTRRYTNAGHYVLEDSTEVVPAIETFLNTHH